MSQDNCTLVRRFFDEVWNQRRAETIEELLAGESVCHADEGPLHGPQEFHDRQFVPMLAAFPDVRVEIDAIVAQEDQVVVRWSARGRHTGDGLGFPPTHEPASFRGVSWIHCRDGKMIEGWQCSNIPEVIRGLAAKVPV